MKRDHAEMAGDVREAQVEHSSVNVLKILKEFCARGKSSRVIESRVKTAGNVRMMAKHVSSAHVFRDSRDLIVPKRCCPAKPRLARTKVCVEIWVVRDSSVHVRMDMVV